MNNRKALKKWRDKRNISKQEVYFCSYKVFVENILEELLEPLFSKKLIEVNVKEIMDTYFPDILLVSSEHDVIDAITDIRVFCENQTEIYGYNSDKTLAEVIKEISSRKQDPKQKKFWKENGYDGTKWKKDTNQVLSTLYVADFTKCKLGL